MGLQTFNNNHLQLLYERPLARIILKKVVTQLADIISKPPKFSDQRINNMLKESNINEVYRHATWVALTSQHMASAITVEKNARDLWTLRAHEISLFERSDFNRLDKLKLLLNKKQINNHIIKLIRTYELIKKNNKPHHVEMYDNVEDEHKNPLDDSYLYSAFNIENNKKIKLDLKVIPAVLCKGHLGDGISIAERIEDIIIKAPELWEQFLTQSKASGVKFLINSALVETSNVTGESAADKIAQGILNGSIVIKAPGETSNDGSAIENITLTHSLQEFRANLDWALTAAKEYSLVPDFNSGDKGTANIQTAEVEASQQNKWTHLEAWQRIKEDEWRKIMFIYGLRSGYKPAKEIDVKLEFIKRAEVKQKTTFDNKKPFNNKGVTNNGQL